MTKVFCKRGALNFMDSAKYWKLNLTSHAIIGDREGNERENFTQLTSFIYCPFSQFEASKHRVE